MKLRLFLFALFAGVVSTATAAPYTPQGWGYPSQRSAEPEAAGEVVRQGLEQLLAFLDTKPRPTGLKLAAFLEERIAERFDFDFMARAAMGPAYRYMTSEQRADLVQKMEQDFLKTLTGGLAGFENQQVKFYRPRPVRGQRASVTVGIANPGSYPARLDFRLYRSADGWKIYDISANGTSAVSYYRQKFSRAFSRPAPYPGRL